MVLVPSPGSMDRKKKNAISKFQKDLNLPSTGQLDSLTLHHLHRATVALGQTEIVLPLKSFGIYDIFFTAKGTWQAVDFYDAASINTSLIMCDKSLEFCDVVFISILGDANDTVSTYRILYEIISWQNNLVIAESGEAAECRKDVLTIAIKTEEITLTSHDLGRCKDTDKKTRRSRLVHGIYGDEIKKIKESVYGEKNIYEALLKNNMSPEVFAPPASKK